MALERTFSSCAAAQRCCDELLDVLSREKFDMRMGQARLTPQGIVAGLRRLSTMAAPQEVPRVIEHDSDDNHVLACALAGRVNLIVSGDKHLHRLGGQYQGILIVTAADAVRRVTG